MSGLLSPNICAGAELYVQTLRECSAETGQALQRRGAAGEQAKHVGYDPELLVHGVQDRPRGLWRIVKSGNREAGHSKTPLLDGKLRASGSADEARDKSFH